VDELLKRKLKNSTLAPYVEERLDRLNARDLDSRLDLDMTASPTWRYSDGGVVKGEDLIYNKRVNAASKVNEYSIL
jgi:hypothetical protein